jgi:hypothetical protein
MFKAATVFYILLVAATIALSAPVVVDLNSGNGFYERGRTTPLVSGLT